MDQTWRTDNHPVYRVTTASQMQLKPIKCLPSNKKSCSLPIRIEWSMVSKAAERLSKVCCDFAIIHR